MQPPFEAQQKRALRHELQLEAGRNQFEREVFPAELATINERRSTLPGATSIDVPGGGNRPHADDGLVGLCFSGGGIRSATFNLGVLQCLARRSVLPLVDYISTVSGGGYIGSCLSSLISGSGKTPAGDKELRADTGGRFPFQYDADAGVEAPATLYLRNSGNYLAPDGILDYLRIPAVLLRGILINAALLLPYVILLAAFTAWALTQPALQTPEYTLNVPLLYVPALSGVALYLFLVALFPLSKRLLRSGSWHVRDIFEQTYAATVAASLALAGCAVIVTVAHWYHVQGNFFENTLTGWLARAGAFIGGLIPLVAAQMATQRSRNRVLQLGMLALGLIAPLAFLWAYAEITHQLIGTDLVPGTTLNEWWWGWLPLFVAVLAMVVARFLVNVNTTALHEFYRDRLSKAYVNRIERDPGSGEATLVQNDELTLQDLSPTAPYHLLCTTLNLTGSRDPSLRGRNGDIFTLSKHYCGCERTNYVPTEAFHDADRHINLATAMAVSGAAASPNMGAFTNRLLVPLMTLLNVRLGYWVPNPAFFGDRAVDGNPLTRAVTAAKKRFFSMARFWGVGPTYLLKELLAATGSEDWFVNLSDGGHLENLGLYPLLKRHCRVIIVSDAEKDRDDKGEMHFGGLAQALRLAKIDLGIDVVFEPGWTLEDLRKETHDTSVAVGEIRYPAPDDKPETGLLVYIKAAYSKPPVCYVREYGESHEEFPHESTADQFFDEAQFEAYRRLGYEIVKALLGEAYDIEKLKGSPAQALQTYFEKRLSKVKAASAA